MDESSKPLAGFSYSRAHFEALVDAAIAHAKKQDAKILIAKLDRFSRNRYDSAHYRHDLKKHGVGLVSVIEQLDDSPEGIIMKSVLEGMSE